MNDNSKVPMIYAVRPLNDIEFVYIALRHCHSLDAFRSLYHQMPPHPTTAITNNPENDNAALKYLPQNPRPSCAICVFNFIAIHSVPFFDTQHLVIFCSSKPSAKTAPRALDGPRRCTTPTTNRRSVSRGTAPACGHSTCARQNKASVELSSHQLHYPYNIMI